VERSGKQEARRSRRFGRREGGKEGELKGLQLTLSCLGSAHERRLRKPK